MDSMLIQSYIDPSCVVSLALALVMVQVREIAYLSTPASLPLLPCALDVDLLAF